MYPVTLLSEGDTTFSCSDDSDSLDVLFDRRKCNAELIRKIAVLRCGKLTDHRIINTSLYLIGFMIGNGLSPVLVFVSIHRSASLLYLTNTRASSSND